MDKVRFGRALGYGTRHAAKTLAAAVDAAATPDPRRGTTGASRPNSDPGSSPMRQASAASTIARAAATPGAARALGRSVWRPLAAFSSVLWLRVTGLFFALIAFAIGNGAWRLRASMHPVVGPTDATRHFWLFSGFAALFAYFAVSSFVRAAIRERRAAARD